ncbi:hypothetical protein Q5P01_008300 [Channa striata]|uniref:Uncharacterized protein n=1 Tax=Channa striata TaxID=64152 RepID=A0AA88SUM0_CHASR|nr:hypothetical protein Q5P01_008300 [Channa striata]
MPTATTREGRCPPLSQLFLASASALSLPLSPQLLISLFQGWSSSLKTEPQSVNKAVSAVNGGRQAGRKKERRRGRARCQQISSCNSHAAESSKTQNKM